MDSHTELHYLVPTGEMPVVWMFEPPVGVPEQSGNYVPHRVVIRDARRLADPPRLDVEGYALVLHVWPQAHLTSDQAVKRILYPETERLVAQATGAERALVFDHNVRRAAKPGHASIPGMRDAVRRVHNDYTAKSGPRRAREILASEETESLLEGRRFALVNVWRPIRGPVRDTPLAVCDARTIEASDLVPTEMRYRDRTGETYAVTFNAGHRWYFVPEMREDEALLIKCFDSATDGRARFTAHAAFEDPTTPPDAPPRESIEFRALVLFGAR
ncbi:MAG TPA: CmcJ/NvfI family oxidoreductase [Polyangiaceae bacterium]|nr:CmcJ/NvfI family oxidoreductase [Polyangiaceae bacterium]